MGGEGDDVAVRILAVGALLGRGDAIISDELNHASIVDGCRLSGASITVYRHADVGDAERALRSVGSARHRLLVTDGVFSMNGDVAPLPELVDLAKRYDAVVMVDDAHATGVLGTRGRGTVDHFGLKGRVQIQIGTLSKRSAPSAASSPPPPTWSTS